MPYNKQKHVEEVIRKIESVVGPICRKAHFEERLKRLKDRGLGICLIQYVFTEEARKNPNNAINMTSKQLLEHNIKCLEKEIEDFDDNILESEPFIDEEIRKRTIGNIVKGLEIQNMSKEKQKL